MLRKQHVREQRSFQFKIGALIGVIILLFSIIIIFHQAKKPMSSARKETITIAKKYAGLETPERFYSSNLGKTYYTISGENKKGEKKYVMVAKSNGNVTILNQSKGITANQAKDTVLNQNQPKKVLNVGLTISDNQPFWCVSYVNKQDKLCFASLTYKTGKIQKVISNI